MQLIFFYHIKKMVKLLYCLTKTSGVSNEQDLTRNKSGGVDPNINRINAGACIDIRSILVVALGSILCFYPLSTVYINM